MKTATQIILIIISWCIFGNAIAADLKVNGPRLKLILPASKVDGASKSSASLADLSSSLASKAGPFIIESLTVTSPALASKSEVQNLRFKPASLTRLRDDDKLQVYLKVATTDDASQRAFAADGLEIEVVNHELKMIQGWASPKSLQRIADDPGVITITAPRYASASRGSVTTEGDAILKANELRSLGVTGKGVKVGIISDGSNDFQQAVASGDLPAQITRFGSCSKAATTPDPENCVFGFSGTCNEGTAMAEIIHDIAPDAELAIASTTTSLEFIQNARRLAFEFGADIIVDDLGFFGEPFYEDGDIAQQIDALPSNVLLITSAGNSAAIHYEDRLDFVDLNNAAIPGFHDFDPSSEEDAFHGFLAPAELGVRLIMQWNEPGRPFSNSANDHNIQIYSQTDFVGETSFDNRGDFAFETACVFNPSTEDEVFFVVVPKPSSFVNLEGNFTIYFLGAPGIEYPIPRGSIFGHTALKRSIAVGTINAQEPGNDQIAFYSSQGPSEIVNPVTGQRTFRAKPDITGIDGTRVTGAGGFSSRFFGTSAAAPHVAGIAALLKSVGGARTGAVREAILEGGVDLGASGFDNVYGGGRLDAILARSALRLGNPAPAIMLLLDEEN